MKTIAFDLNGNDNGVRAGIEAVIEFVKVNLDYIFILVGDKKEISKYVKDTERIKIIDKPELATSTKGALAARKSDSSMATAIRLVKDGKAQAVISSGDSGSYLSMTTLILKRMKGIKRPAFMPVMPTITKNNNFVMMDVGANLETTSDMLVQWSYLGNSFAKSALEISKPRVGIINIGTEPTKGFIWQQEAAKVLAKDKKINFVGFVEPRNLLKGVVDVAVVDGYAGNMILKTMEGTSLTLLSLLKEKLMSKTKYKIGALLSKGAFKGVKDQLDYRNVGAAWVMGLNGLAIKTHGSSDKKSYLGAFGQIANAFNTSTLEKIKKDFS